jgi:hypothetical protein
MVAIDFGAKKRRSNVAHGLIVTVASAHTVYFVIGSL